MKINNSCVLEHIRTLPDKSVNTTFADFPYFLGTEWHYVNGKLQMKGEGKDFMTKWSVNNADWWREYFVELYRVMKFGGYVCMYSIDRQAWAFQSLMIEAGFNVCQTLYWANIGNFPKARDASKNIDRALKVEREVMGSRIKSESYDYKGNNTFNNNGNLDKIELNITAPATALSKLFESHKYGKAPFKKITEPLLIFRKAPKNGSVLNDLLAFQNDSEISPSVIDVENNRIGLDLENDKNIRANSKNYNSQGDSGFLSGETYNSKGAKAKQDLGYHNSQGRFPCTIFNDKASAELLDSQLDKISFELNGKIYERKRRIEYQQLIWQHTQNGTLQSFKVLNVEREIMQANEGLKNKNGDANFFSGKKAEPNKLAGFTDSGFLSRVMHTADFTEDDYDSLVSALNAYSNGINQDTYYEPTVSPKERNLGLNITKKINKRPIGEAFGEGNIFSDSQSETNNHPTLKPIKINKLFLSLFRLPKGITQTLYIPFSGVGSEIIGAIQAGYNIDNIISCEINPDYVEIAKSRIAYYRGLQPEVIEQKQVNNLQFKTTLF